MSQRASYPRASYPRGRGTPSEQATPEVGACPASKLPQRSGHARGQGTPKETSNDRIQRNKETIQ